MWVLLVRLASEVGGLPQGGGHHSVYEGAKKTQRYSWLSAWGEPRAAGPAWSGNRQRFSSDSEPHHQLSWVLTCRLGHFFSLHNGTDVTWLLCLHFSEEPRLTHMYSFNVHSFTWLIQPSFSLFESPLRKSLLGSACPILYWDYMRHANSLLDKFWILTYAQSSMPALLRVPSHGST